MAQAREVTEDAFPDKALEPLVADEASYGWLLTWSEQNVREEILASSLSDFRDCDAILAREHARLRNVMTRIEKRRHFIKGVALGHINES